MLPKTTEIPHIHNEKVTIDKVRNKIEIIKSITTDEFWDNSNTLAFEEVRKDLRELINSIAEQGELEKIYTNLKDVVMEKTEGQDIGVAYEFDDYRLKVNRYIEQNKNAIAISKLRNNIPLTKADYNVLESILTNELDNQDDYTREFGDTPFGLLIRKIAKLEQEVATGVFSTFISEQNLNQQQIVFVNKIIDYVTRNGYIENSSRLLKSPFDKPVKFIELFDSTSQKKLIDLVRSIKENAENVVG